MLSESAGAQNEVVWWQFPGQRTGNRHSGATGGGISTVFIRPVWQTPISIAPIDRGNLDGRVVPDVAALAGPPLYELILLGRPSANGGTSASAALWASLVARLDALLPTGKRQRFLAPLLYRPTTPGGTIGAAGCTDITSGNNASHPHPGKGYWAAPGYDAVTGWGVPNGNALLAALTRLE